MLRLLLFFFSYKNVRNGAFTRRIYVSCMQGQCFSSSVQPGKRYRETCVFVSLCSWDGTFSTIGSSGSFITTQGDEHLIIQSSIVLYLPRGRNCTNFQYPSKQITHECTGFQSTRAPFFSHCINTS